VKASGAKAVIEAENTLDMIKKALGGGLSDAKPAKKKSTTGLKKKKAAEPVDKLQKFFNHYADNPHLQSIENGYLKYLQV